MTVPFSTESLDIVSGCLVTGPGRLAFLEVWGTTL